MHTDLPTLDQSPTPGNKGTTPPAPPARPEDRHDRPPIDPVHACAVLLHAIVKQLAKLTRGHDFNLTVIVNNSGSVQRQTATNAAGVVRFIHNPTASAVTLTFYDGGKAGSPQPLFNASLASGASLYCYIPFTVDISATSGSGLQIAGAYR